MEHFSLLTLITIATALLFAFTNGFHDSSNIVAIMISTRVLSPRAALGIAAAAEFIGPFLFGTAVAATIGKDIVAPESITAWVVLAALLGAIAWNLITWYFAIPSSSSHALIGGLIGAVTVASDWRYIQFDGLMKVILALILAPVLGIVFGFLCMKLIQLTTRKATTRITGLFKGLTFLSAIGLALSHGTNDAQKTAGIIVMALMITGVLKGFSVPAWVILISAFAITIGIATGGWRIIKTVGRGIYKIKIVHGFCSQTISAVIILAASLMGGPVSTTHVLSSSIMGIGAAERVNAVKWTMAKNILITWVLTIPASALVAAGIYWVMSLFI